MLIPMQTDLLAIIFGLGAGIGWGFSGFFDAKASKTVGPLRASLLINWFVALAYAVLYLFLPHNHGWDAAGVWYAIASGVVITVGAISYFKGLAVGPVSLVSPLSASYPLVTTLVALSLFRAHISMLQIGAIIMIMSGVLAASGIFSAKVGNRRIHTGPALAIFTSIAWGLGYSFASQAIARLGWQQASVVEFGAMALMFLICIPVVSKERIAIRSYISGMRNHYVLLSGSISLCAALALNVGLSREHSSGAIVATLSACYPVLTVLLARRHFDEQVALVPFVGALTSIAGVILLSCSS